MSKDMNWSSTFTRLILIAICLVKFGIRTEVLTPPYFNLALGRRIVATSTCGEEVPEPELYCKLVGADPEKELNHKEYIIQGQFCDHCDPNSSDKRHPPEFAVDGRETRWQSPPLSRGEKYDEVNVTIDLGQEFHVAYVIVKMGNSPRPSVWALERSDDNGQTFVPWQYFAPNARKCREFFGADVKFTITADNSVICNTQYSQAVPLEGGEIAVPLVQDRPSADDFFNSSVLQEWTRATNVRFRLLKVNTLLGHYMSLSNRDTSTTRRYFYSIKEISIGGRCRCNGHAYTCTSVDQNDPYKLVCDCQHHTCGNNCEVCCPGFEQKKWSQSKINRKFVCEPCNCFGHSSQCVYNETVDRLRLSLDIHGNLEGGGVCQHCQDNTEGINCDRCVHGYYRRPGILLNDTNVCDKCKCDTIYSTGNCEDYTGRCECKPEYTKPNCDSCSFGYYGYPICRPCSCFINGTTDLACEVAGEVQCSCKINYGGKYCRSCAEGYYNFPECKSCECSKVGSSSNNCDIDSGKCKCKNSFGGQNCEQCSDGYYAFPSCTYCNCDVKGTLQEVCDKNNGQCLCKPGYGGARCDQCVAGFTGFPECKSCNCSTIGSASSVCDVTGKCTCLFNFGGKQCDQCTPGFFQYPNCTACNCDVSGTYGLTCNNDGSCICKFNFDGEKCQECKSGYYNYPVCEECNYNPAGVISNFTGCNTLRPGALFKGIDCKENVQGKQCNDCKERYWNLQSWNPFGCEDCACNVNGTVGGISSCNSKSGQCFCRTSVSTRRCEQCMDGFYNLTGSNFFGCTDCECDIGGSMNNICDKNNGQCNCLPRVVGRNCKRPLDLHYFPTLHQFQFEVEEGSTPPNSNPVRYGFEDSIFPGYSWKGYAVFSYLQNETNHNIIISSPSVYRMILRYMNPNSISVSGMISVLPVPDDLNNLDVEQKFSVVFKPTTDPSFVTVAGILGSTPSPFVLNPGSWTVKFKIEKSLFLDYFVLIPSEYSEASLLVSNVTSPCTIDRGGICKHYLYPNVSSFDRVRGVGGYINNGANRSPIEDFTNDYPNQRMPLITNLQSTLNMDLTLTRPGNYTFVVIYGTVQDQYEATIEVDIRTQYSSKKGVVKVSRCRYSTLCRQSVLDRSGQVAVYQIDSNFVNLALTSSGNGIGIESVIAIPADEWSLDYVQPKEACIMKDKICTPSKYSTPPNSKKIEFKTGNEDRVAKVLPPAILDNGTELIFLNVDSGTLDLKGKATKAGSYTFVVHYYQPDFPEYGLDIIIQNGVFYEAKLSLKHCPNYSGCRSVVKQQANGNSVFQLLENFTFSIQKLLKGKGIWLHYLLVIPSSEYSEQILFEHPFDQTAMFISQCGADNFYLNTSVEGFCRDATFSLTTKYNHGTQACSCDFQGSYTFECAAFGGQCPCRPNIIGRRCDTCKTKYFGFPNCQPCNCPSKALCDANTGECICPENVLGEKCDRCRPDTYGMDPVYGCFECLCNYQGVKNNNFQCDLVTGACECKENVEGRTCDRCVAGHWQFPWCTPCDCDPRGTTTDVCNQANADCMCKSNVNGQACDVCKDGSFNLQKENEEGCTKCFCFGKTTRCSSSTLFFTPMSSYDDWSLATIDTSKSVEVTPLATNVDETSDGIVVNFDLVVDNVTYFVAPELFRGNKLASYGGSLTYMLNYDAFANAKSIGGADVILFGANMYLKYESLDAPSAGSNFWMTMKIVENNFYTLSGNTVAREDLMQILQNLTAVYIKATYSDGARRTRISNVSLEVAVLEYTLDANVALSIEQCHCPPNYVGLSCEVCADGFYRAQTGPFGGYCVPCQCNGHTATCDKATGLCIDCKNNTKGEHCEECEVGYYGSANVGTPNDCLICACPLPKASNNFATSCEFLDQSDKIICKCKPGYMGDQCERCADGFYGRPDVAGELCVPCQCNDNIDPSVPDSCDHVTGRCLLCLNNTFGDSCERCRPGYFGDAIAKTCQPCDCDNCGTSECDHKTGTCRCLTNVIGSKCDRCTDNHFGFTSCQGCSLCNCAAASESAQCDDLTGHCRCRGGVTGQICDHCLPGYWNYTSNGCISCGCNTEYSAGFGCNEKTGTCECLPGVVGDKCNECPHRWVLIKNVGCYECIGCTDGLLNITDQLYIDFSPVFSQFQTASIGYFTVQRLKFINDTVDKYVSEVSDIVAHQFDLTPFDEKVMMLENNAEIVRRNVKAIYDDALAAAMTGSLTHQKTQALDMMINKLDQTVGRTVSEVNNFVYSLETGAVQQVDYALKEARTLISDIKYMDLDVEKESDLEKTVLQVQEISQSVKKFAEPVLMLTEKLKTTQEKDETLHKKLDDLEDYSNKARQYATEAIGLNQLQKKAQLHEKIDKLHNNTVDAENSLSALPEITQNTTSLLQIAKSDLDTLGDQKEKLVQEKHTINENVKNLQNDINKLKVTTLDAEKHAKDLLAQARTLGSSAEIPKEANEAVNAATAYRTINNNLEYALENATIAAKDVKQAVEKSTGLVERAQNTLTSSITKQNNAQHVLAEIQLELAPKLNNFINLQNSSSVSINQTDVEPIKKKIKSLEEQGSVTDKIEKLKVNKAVNKIKHVENEMKEVIENLPEKVNRTKILKENLVNKKKQIQDAGNYVNQMNEYAPSIQTQIDSLKEKPGKLNDSLKNITDGLQLLKQQILRARDMASKIKLGVKLSDRTSLELPLPESLFDQGSSNDISFYFKTDLLNALLLYLGNEALPTRKKREVIRRLRTNDYLIVLLENGYPQLKLNLGDKPVSTIVINNPLLPNTWHNVMIRRNGKIVNFTVVDPNGTKYSSRGECQGVSSVLNLDKDYSKFFFGGVPSSFEAPTELRQHTFRGEFQDLVVNGEPIGFWNFLNVSLPPNVPIKSNLNGSVEREVLLEKISTKSIRFNGNGYVKLEVAGYLDPEKNSISMNFKSTTPDGLLFLAFKGEKFMALEIRSGYINFRYNVGRGLKLLRSVDNFNNGEWHTIQATRVGNEGALTIDTNPPVVSSTSSNLGASFELPQYLYLAGFDGDHNLPEVMKTGYDGCLDNIQVGDKSVTVNNINSYKALPGCLDPFSSFVSFDEGAHGYVKWIVPPTVNRDAPYNLEISLRIKTKAKNGLILYGLGRLTSFSLLISEGTVLFKSGKQEVKSSENMKYNDNRWHAITAINEPDSLHLNIDDFDLFKSPKPPAAVNFDSIEKIYFGTVPSDIDASAAIERPFGGCIGDVAFNGVVINFHNITEAKRAIIGHCSGIPKDIEAKLGDGNGSQTKTSTSFIVTSTSPAPPVTVAPGSLPLIPQPDPDLTEENGIRFGTTKITSLMYDFDPTDLEETISLSMELKTVKADGIIFYVANPEKDDFISLYLKELNLYLKYRCDVKSGTVSRLMVNQAEWHTVKFIINSKGAGLMINGEESTGPIGCSSISLASPYYVGGFEDFDILKQAQVDLESRIGAFVGCLKHFKPGGRFSSNPRRLGVIPCSNKVEEGTFIAAGSYIKTYENFNVGETISIEMHIKPRVQSGLLIAVHSNKDFLVLKMTNGHINFTVDNGNGKPVSAVFKPQAANYFLDNTFHKIHAYKSKNLVILTVDGNSSSPVFDLGSNLVTNTNHPLYIGGYPPTLASSRGIETKSQFVGCIKMVKINEKSEDLSLFTPYGDVMFNVCPTI